MNHLSIGTIASRCGVSADTIRHYERKGVLTDIARDASGYRRFAATTVDRVRVIRRALEIGFTLDELARIFKQRASGHPPCREVRELAARKLIELEEQLAALEAVRAALLHTISSWDARLQSTPGGEMAHLLDALIDQKEDFS